MTTMTGNLIESLIETVAKFEHKHTCVACGAKLECDPTDCVAEENLVCNLCDGR